MLAQAKLEAEKLHTQMLERAREDIRTLQTNWTDDLERERNEFLLDLRRRAAAQIFEITRRTLADLTRVDIEECAVKVFLDKIQLIDDETCRSLAQGELVIRTPLDLPDEVRTQIRQVLEIRLQAPVMLRFQKAFGIGLGLELVGNGWRIGWNSDTYLDALEEDVRGALEHCKEPESVGVP